MQTMLVYSSSLTNRAGHCSKTIKEKMLKPHMVVYACNFSPNVEALGQKSKISLDYLGDSRSACDRWDPVRKIKGKGTQPYQYDLSSQETSQGMPNPAWLPKPLIHQVAWFKLQKCDCVRYFSHPQHWIPEQKQITGGIINLAPGLRVTAH